MTGVISHRVEHSTIGIDRHIFYWQSDSAGSAEMFLDPIRGRLLYGTTAPVEGAQPTDNYDVKLLDEWGNDSMQSLLVNRDDTNPELQPIYDGLSGGYKYAYVSDSGRYKFRVANAGDTKSGIVCIYILTA